MENDPFCSFIDLVNFDQKMFKTRSNLQDSKKEAENLLSQLSSLKNSIELKKQSLISAQKDVDQTELQMKDLDLLEKEKKEKLELISNEKEYSSLKKEIERIKQSQHKLEPELVISWNKLNFEQEDFDTKKNEFIKRVEEIENQITQKNIQIKELEDQLLQHGSQRKAKEIGIPQEWLTKYNIMHTRVTNPVIPVTHNSCSACFHHLTNQDIIDLNLKKLLQCKNCFRLLYLEAIKDQKCDKAT